jgi:hypothetical protein
VSHALHGDAKGIATGFDIENPPDNVALGGPQVHQAFVLLAGNGILRLR